jgi:hypothetical protein
MINEGRKQDRQIEKDSKTDRESVHEKERKWLDGTTNDKENKQRGRKQDR